MSQYEQSGAWLALDKASEQVSEAGRIHALLKSIQDARALVSVSICGRKGVYNSAILDCDLNKHEFVLDELTPLEGHVRLLQSACLSVYARVNGIGIYFESPLGDVGVQDNIAYYRQPLPQRVFYGQKRADYRVRPAMDTPIPIVLGDTQPIAEGELLDLSAGGIGLRVGVDTPVIAGETLNTCLITLPGGDTLCCRLQIRFVRQDPNAHELQLGARFLGLNPTQQRAVRRCVAELERAGLQRHERR